MASKTKKKRAKKSTTPSKSKSSNQQVDLTKQDISLCLVMIVKDEEDTIRRCLTQVSPYISYYVIVDTGSSDNTIQEINSTMEELGIDGEVHERPWVNFEVNRTESLQLAKGKCDYRWIIDADDTFRVANPEVNPFSNLPKEKVDCLQILYKLNNLQYHRAQIVRSDQDWFIRGYSMNIWNYLGRNL
jgi:glycosyltransferase involved in cell wall biosynthesis